MQNENREKAFAALLSVVSNLGLVCLKLVVGLLTGSVSVISEAIHSGVDLLASLIAFFSVRASAKPADKEHPFGHGKYENLSGTVEAFLIFLAALFIIHESIDKLIHPKPLQETSLGVGIMLISTVVNILVSRYLFRVGNRTDSAALKADAWHLRTDVYTSFGVMIGLATIWVGKKLFPDKDLEWIDPMAAMGVAILILKAAFMLTRESARDLLDASLPDEEENLIQHHIAEFVPTARGVHGLRTRKSGPQRQVEFHLLVDGEMSVDASHQITDSITQAIREHYPGTQVTIHIEPCKFVCTAKCEKGCLLEADERNKNHSTL